jgi:hypothetical protein
VPVKCLVANVIKVEAEKERAVNITGKLTSVQVFENRSNLFIINVLANEYSGRFNCDIQNLLLDGERVSRASDVAKFVESRHVQAILTGVDNTTGGIGSRLCDRIELITVLE